ncbi:MAG: hypothetical protein Kow0037_16020 [Calditrichia bacterium]
MFSDNMLVFHKERNETAKNSLMRVKPRVDVFEKEEAVIVRLEMPGVERENLQVTVKDGTLHIVGDRTFPKNEGEYWLRELPDVRFERIFELEEDLDTDKISAEYHHGILTVSIGKKEKAKPKVIEIN